jgi:phosphoribosylaminoimidazole carboxylase
MSGNKYITIKNIFADIGQESDYINLDKSIVAYKKILDLLQKPVKLIVFYGKPGCGKTFLLKKIVSDLKEQQGDVVFFPYPFFNEAEFVTSLYEGIFKKEPQEKIESYEQFIKIYKAKTDDVQDRKPVVVILDESQLYPEILLEKIRIMSDSGLFKFLFATHEYIDRDILSRDYFKTRVWENIEMGSVDVGEMKVYLENKFQNNQFYYIFSKFTESQFEILNSLSQGNLRMLNKLMFNIFELYEYFDANQPTIIGGNTMVTKIIEMAAIKSELIDA